MVEARYQTDQIPAHFQQFLGGFTTQMTTTPTLRHADVVRLIAQATAQISPDRTQLTISNYRNMQPPDTSDPKWQGDCIACAVQQYEYFIRHYLTTYSGILIPAIFQVLNDKGWNHFMFGILDTSTTQGQIGLAFDNEVQNSPVPIKAQDPNLIKIFTNPTQHWQFAPHDSYALAQGAQGWPAHEHGCFRSILGPANKLGITQSTQNAFIVVSASPPHLDIVIDQTSVTTEYPDSTLATLCFKLQDQVN